MSSVGEAQERKIMRIGILGAGAIGAAFARRPSEQVAAPARGARVLKVLNHLFAASLAADPHEAGGRRVLFVSGDDAAAKKAFTGVLDDLGYAPIDLGGPAEGGRLHQARGGPPAGQDLVRLAVA
jgi:predicted dinucleotide-binding enzyme